MRTASRPPRRRLLRLSGQPRRRAFRQALGFVGLDFYPGSSIRRRWARRHLPQRHRPGRGVVRDCLMPLAGARRARSRSGSPRTGSPPGPAPGSPAGRGLSQLVSAARDYSGTFNITDYRWFNLRDSNASDTAGSLPGVATTFATDGLLRDDYTPKPAYGAYQAAIAAFGRLAPPTPVPWRCPTRGFRIALRRERRAIRRVSVYLGRRRVGHAVGRRLAQFW